MKTADRLARLPIFQWTWYLDLMPFQAYRETDNICRKCWLILSNCRNTVIEKMNNDDQGDLNAQGISTSRPQKSAAKQ